ncbi:hypothetical protein [Zoogloea sp.]|uniref:hypothetical protein n=1 Tax=Zoogloea sp. TaxID=49181 RepID=UPI0035AE99CC
MALELDSDVVMSLPVLMIAFWQAVAVFVLCLFAKNRGYAVLIGLVGCAVVTITGSYRYGWLDVLFVIAATLAAVWKLTPYGGDETPGEILAFAGKAAGVVLGVVACGAAGLWYYTNHAAVIEVAANDESFRSLSRPTAELKPRAIQLEGPIIEAPEPVPTSPLQPIPQEGLVPAWKFSEIKPGMTEAEIVAVVGPPGSVIEVRSSDGRKTSAMWRYRTDGGGEHSLMIHNGRYR